MRIRSNRRLAATLAAWALGGCAVGPGYKAPTSSALGVPQSYGVVGSTAAPIDLSVWWRRFDDPELTALIDKATVANLDIAVSRARWVQAREQLIQARASLLPTVTGSAGAGRSSVWAPTTTTTIGGVAYSSGGSSGATHLSLGLDATWQADVFGGGRRSVEAARASRDAALFDLAGVRTAVAGEVATNYIDARLAQARLAIARDALRIQDDNLQIAQWRVQAGLTSATDALQARAQRAETEASIPLLETSYASAVNRLGVLTGQAPAALRPELDPGGPVPRGPDAVSVGVPADTLRQRPDVRAAERNLAAATARIGVAEAQLYPALTLPGSLTAAVSRLDGPATISGQAFANVGQTIFGAGRLRSQLRSARAGADSAFAAYRQTVLTGLEDVENGIQALNSAKARQGSLAVAVEASDNAAVLARAQYRVGRTDFLTLLQSEQSRLSTRDSLAAVQADQALALVRLYLALGGGWQAASPTNANRDSTQ